jgi:hypothetical protein
MYALPTVKIKSEVSDENPLGFIVINEDDFDAAQHELFVEAAGPAEDSKQVAEAKAAKGGETGAAKPDGEAGGSNEGAAAPAYRAEHRGRGSYSVMSGDDEVAQGLTKDEAIAFNALSDVEKGVFVAMRDEA